MKISHSTLSILLVIFSVCNLKSQRLEKPMNDAWKFSQSNDSLAADIQFDDVDWSLVDIPHDWSFENGISKDGAQKANGGYFSGGIGWYRKNIEISEDWKDKRVYIEFDGVYMNSEVWINGHYLGKRPYGYTRFRYDLSEFLNVGDNMLSVKVDNSLEPSARWYHPSGIYAPVKLIITEKQFISPNGIYATSMVMADGSAQIKVSTSLENQGKSKGKAILETIFTDSEGKEIATNRQPFKWDKSVQKELKNTLKIAQPELWSPDSPYLYVIKSKLIQKGKVIDEVTTNFGIRTILWDTETGFSLNGQVTKLLGVSEHYEGGPVGGAWTKPLLRWKLKLLKEMGVNAVRTAHNPAPPMFYDLCDELGIMVMDEIFDGWKRKAPEDYGKQAFDEWWEKDMTEWLSSNRNHPSIIIYSVGNETKGEIARQLVALCHQLDPTKPVTSGHSSSEFMDVFGVNGGSEKKSFFTKERPNKPFVSTEAPHTWQTRGYYRSKTWYRDGYKEPIVFEIPDLTEEEIFEYEWSAASNWTNGKQHFNSSYDNGTVRISARKNWELMRDLPWFSGHFRWTGFDYYGEAGYVHGGWPFRLFMSGAIDVAGFEKDLFYFYKSQWTENPMVHILPHWTHPIMDKGTEIPVWVYSNCDEVELFFDGQSLGKDIPGKMAEEMQCEWMVPWKPGTLTAKGYIDGKAVVETNIKTSKTPADISLALENLEIKTGEVNNAIVTSTITDGEGTMYPYGENQLFYHIQGPAKFVSLENGDPVDTTGYVNVLKKKAFMGLSRAFLKLDNQDDPVLLTVGSILGEKNLMTSNEISIVVKSINLRGQSQHPEANIYYTTDGSKPTELSKLYKGAFEIKPGTTVKAIAVWKGETLLEMNEQFDRNLGLHWGDNQPEAAISGNSAMSSEDAIISGASIMSAKGTSYADFSGQEGSISWYQENDGDAGNFLLTFSYATADEQSKRPMELYVNDQLIKTIPFKPTGSWNSKWAEIEARCKLKAGANYIELRTTGQSAPNISSLLVELL
ncbi:MAG: glycoside hydrolase family 2 TIM barrel-domain containing protein [Cyclobacteriaceae bacterium]